MKKIKTVVFLSNYFNHHQQPISDAFFAQLGSGYHFIETEEMEQERKGMGWGMEKIPSYVITSRAFQENQSDIETLIEQADAVIIGSAPMSLVKRRVNQNRLTFVYSEHPLKKGFEFWKYPYRFFRLRLLGYSRRCVCLLGASAYAARDYAKFFLFRNRSFQWGYFPETYRYDSVDHLISAKTENSMIWVARLLEWKHPELAVELGKRLKQDGYSFQMDMIGSGCLQEKIARMVKRAGLENEIRLLDTMTPAEVRKHMEKARIHIFTSDRKEGWGAVLNEAMNSGCVPVADRNIGSAPCLIEQGKNGFLYSGFEELYEHVKYLLDHRGICMEMGKAAYRKIAIEWNAENAASRFLALSAGLLAGNGDDSAADNGVCSKVQ